MQHPSMTNKIIPNPLFEHKIITLNWLLVNLLQIKATNKIIFTNGCFDIIHSGHVTYLAQAKSLGDKLIVAVNSDESVREQNKGINRPINQLHNRMLVIAALEAVDYVISFNANTPYELITAIMPDILVKGGDWEIDSIVGAKEVLANQGEVYSIPFIHHTSTTNIINKIHQFPQK